MDPKENMRLVTVDTNAYFAHSIFAKHSLELQETVGNRHYALKTDSAGKRFHWYVIVIPYVASNQPSMKAVTRRAIKEMNVNLCDAEWRSKHHTSKGILGGSEVQILYRTYSLGTSLPAQ